jgi:hypothetical protein
MAKPKDKYQGPEIYRNLNQDNRNAKLCIVLPEGTNPKMYKYASRKDCPLPDKDIKMHYVDWDAFEQDKNWQMPQLEEEHKKLFGHPIPPKLNRAEVSLIIWHKWCETAEDKTKVAVTTGRKSTIESRIYTRVYEDGKPTQAQLKTPQAMACLKIFEESMDTEKHTISEKDLKDAVIKRAAELKTRQDPWRIFQYYRPQLIQAKLIRHS